MGKRLAGFDDPQELMNFVVFETRKRLNAETSSLFLLNGEVFIARRLPASKRIGWPKSATSWARALPGR